MLSAGKAELTAQNHTPDRHAESQEWVQRIGDDTVDLGRKRGRHSFIGVDGNHPISGSQPKDEITLAGEVIKGTNRNNVGVLPSDIQSCVATGRVDDDD